MSIEVNIGSKLPLNLLLDDGAIDKYPLAHVYDQANVEVAGSPFALTHVAEGYYDNNTTYTVANSDIRLNAVYIIYEDPGFTEESGIYTRAADVFDIDNTSSGAGIVSYYYTSVPEVLELPTTGTQKFRMVLYTFDSGGHPADPDLQQAFIHIEQINNVEILTSTAMTREQIGVYWYKYEVTSIDVEQPLWAEFTFVGGGVNYLVGETTATLRVRSVLEVIENQRLTAARATKLDFLDAAITSRQSEVNAFTRFNSLTADVNQNEVKIDAINTLIGVPFGGSVATATNAIKAATDKIGNPVFGTLAGDNIVAWAELIKIGVPLSGTLAGDIAAIQTKLGLPAGASVSADIAAIKAETLRIGIPHHGTLAADHVHIDNLIGTPVVSLATDIASVAGQITNLDTKVGTPFSGTVSGDLQDIDNEVDTLINRLSVGRASNLDYLDVFVSSRASQSTLDTYYNTLNLNDAAILAAIGATPNNTTFVGIVPNVMVLPIAGSKDYKFYVNLFDIAGAPNNADGSVMMTIKKVDGTTLFGPTAMSNVATGRYEKVYAVSYSDVEQPLVVFFDYTENAIVFQQARLTEVQEFESKLDTLIARLTATRANNLDYLDVAVSTRESDSAAEIRKLNINANVDANEVLINQILAKIGIPSISVSADIAAIYSYAVKIGIPVHGTLALDAAAIQAEVDKIGVPSHGTLAADDLYLETKIGPSVSGSLTSDIALVKVATDKIGATTFGTITADIADIKSTLTGPITTAIGGVQTTSNLIAVRQGVPITTIAGDIAAISTKLGTPAGPSVSSDIASIKLDTSYIGVPVHGSLASDNIVMESKENTIIADIASLEAHLDLQDISLADIDSEVDKIGPSTFGTITADIANINAKLGVPVTTISGDIAAITISSPDITDILNIVTDIQDEMGVIPGADTLASELLSLHSDLLTIPTNTLLNNDPRLNYLDAAISSRATPADVNISSSDGISFELVGMLDSDDTELVGIIEEN